MLLTRVSLIMIAGGFVFEDLPDFFVFIAKYEHIGYSFVLSQFSTNIQIVIVINVYFKTRTLLRFIMVSVS